MFVPQLAYQVSAACLSEYDIGVVYNLNPSKKWAKIGETKVVSLAGPEKISRIVADLRIPYNKGRFGSCI